MSEVNWSRLISIAIITSLLSCGMLAPFWAIGLLVVYMTQPAKPIPKKPVVIPPSNEFADDWEFKMYEIQTESV